MIITANASSHRKKIPDGRYTLSNPGLCELFMHLEGFLGFFIFETFFTVKLISKIYDSTPLMSPEAKFDFMGLKYHKSIQRTKSFKCRHNYCASTHL